MKNHKLSAQKFLRQLFINTKNTTEARGESRKKERKRATSDLLFVLLRNFPSELVHELTFLSKSPSRVTL